jgi:S-DNA-T family DNA segregation ATPase FtsK/SpoIIIE
MASLGASVAVVGTGSTLAHNPVFLLFPATMVISALAAGAAAGGGRQRTELDADRQGYLRYLASVSDRLTHDAATARNWMLSNHPEPQALWTVIGAAGMWARHRDEPDFCVVRAGVGAVPATTRPVAPDMDRSGERDPVTTAALNRLLRGHGHIPDAPVIVALPGGGTVTVSGSSDRARALVRAVICQLTVLHSPADVGVLAVCDETQRSHWDWMKWLPHQEHCRPDVNLRRVVVMDGGGADAGPDDTTTVLQIKAGAADDPAGALRLDAGAGELLLTRPDQMTSVEALAVARRLARFSAVADCTAGSGDWLAKVGVTDPARIDPETLWDNKVDAALRVPIGISPDGNPVDLDIREAAEGGMGPHGLCLGSTGSGKSELLRTIALGMIARHSPKELNLILVDFKGGATFLEMARVQHTTAVITNLEDEIHLVDRMREALGGEIDRRQRILRAAGNIAGIADYNRARRGGRALTPLPALLIIVDEFSELLCRHPEFVDVFVAIGRLGRSLGMHLLLASQRLDEGRLRGLDSHLSYRICLKTLSAGESRIAIGVPDAYHLPGRPGAAYLKVGAAEPVRFQASHVSDRLPVARTDPSALDAAPRLFSWGDVGPDVATRETAPDDTQPRRTLLEAVLDGLAGHGPSPHQVWLPPMTSSPRLEVLLAGHGGDGLRVPIGLVDMAFEHRRDPLVVDLSGAAGNVAVIGAPQTGKTTAVRTLVTALAATHDPRQVQVYCLDFGGGELGDLTALPHVGTVAGRPNIDLVRRTVVEVVAVLRRREAGGGGHDGHGDVFLVVDGWAAARQEHDGLEPAVTAIAGAGLSHRVHVVLTASRWADVRPALRDQIGTRVELRLGDPADSEIDRARARQVPRDRPGHGLSPDGSPMIIALSSSDFADFRTSPDGWQAPTIRTLPARVCYADVLASAAGPGCVLGIAEDTLMPVTLDFAEQHLLVFGEPGCGKTAVLRLLCHEIARCVPGGRVVPVDPRQTLAEFGGDGARGLPVLIEMLRGRIGVTQAGAEPVYVVVDDYDLAASALTPLADLLPHARDIGLHLVVARRSGGAARALYEPVLAGLRETGAMGLQMSAGPDDGPLVGGVRPRPLPPGRGVLVTRADGERTIQVTWAEPG